MRRNCNIYNIYLTEDYTNIMADVVKEMAELQAVVKMVVQEVVRLREVLASQVDNFEKLEAAADAADRMEKELLALLPVQGSAAGVNE